MATKETSRQTEKQLTAQVCKYIKLQYPDVIFTADASGLRLSIGQATQLKTLRSSRGLPDLMIFEPRGNYHGLFIELKREGEKIYKKNGEPKTEHIAEQLGILNGLNYLGYYANLAIGFNEAKQIIDKYMTL